MAEVRRPTVYRPERAEGEFDAIVIGSGMGGLAAAALLSRAGKRVLVLERHYAMGGFTHTFRRKQYEWDVGVHYVGEFHTRGTLAKQLIDDVSEGRLQWAPMPARYDRFLFPDATYDYVAGRDAFVDEVARSFPSERAAIARYVKLCDEAYAAAMPFFQQKALPPILAPVTRPLLCRRFLKLARRTTLSVLRDLTDDPRLIGVLTGAWGTYGLPPARSSFGIHGLIASHYLDGAAYPVGGAGAIASSILPTIEASGGRLLVHAEVEEILVRGGRSVGVRVAGGQTLEAPVVLSDAGVANTFGSLLDGETQTRFGLKALLDGVEPSVSHVCLYVGFDQSPEEVGLEATNLWIYPSYDHDRNVFEFEEDPDAPLPAAYISFPSAKDPSYEARRGQTATLEIMTFAPYDWFARWQDARWRKRGEEYEELKSRFAERLLAALYEHVPQTQGKVDYFELSTPVSTRHFSGHPHGEIYGLAFTPDRFDLRWLAPHTPIGGLYLTGQDAVTHGVLGALLGGVVAASAVLGRNVIKDVRRRRRRETGA